MSPYIGSGKFITLFPYLHLSSCDPDLSKCNILFVHLSQVSRCSRYFSKRVRPVLNMLNIDSQLKVWVITLQIMIDWLTDSWNIMQELYRFSNYNMLSTQTSKQTSSKQVAIIFLWLRMGFSLAILTTCHLNSVTT